MKKIIALLLTILCSLPTLAQAQTLTNYLKADVQIPTAYNEPLRIQLQSNDSLCKREYGDEQYRICSPYVGDYGARVYSVSMEPKIEGTWYWEDSSVLAFRPTSKAKWEPNTSYKISIDQDTLPAEAKLPTYNYSFSTLAQAAQLSSQRFWTDTSEKAEHVYSATFSFLYPIEDKVEIERNLSVAPQNAHSGLEFGAPEYVWSREDSRLTVNMPVKSLAQSNTLVQISLKNMFSYYYDRGIRISDSPLQQRIDIPGLNNLFQVNSANLTVEYNDELKQEFILNIETSLQTSSQNIANALEIFALPKKSSEEASVAYEWDKALVVDEGRPVKFHAIEQNISTRHSFKVDIEPETYINVVFSENMKSQSGLNFSESRNTVLYASKFTPEISFLQNGNILNLEGSKEVAVQTSQLTELKWEAYKVRTPYIAFIADEYFNNNDFHSYDYDRQSTNYDELSEIVSGTIKLEGMGKADSEVVYLDMQNLISNFKEAETSGLIRLKLTGMQDDIEVVSAEKALLLTDIGMLVKRNANGTRNVFTYSLSTNKPLRNTQIQILGENGVALTSAQTNSDGMALLENVDGFTKDKAPAVLTAYNKNNNDYSFVAMDSLMRSVETSRFSTGGRMQSLSNFQAYIFAERGLFRPGDELRFGLIVRNSDNSLVTSLPVKVALYDPQNVKVAEKSFNMQDVPYGMVSFEWQSFDYSQAGIYRLDVLSGDTVLGTKTVRLEEFQPNVLEISTEILPKKTNGWHVISSNNDFKLEVELTNLYGTGAQDRKVTANLSINPMTLHFDGYADYTFRDPYADYASFANPNLSLPDATTNDKGMATFEIDLDAYAQSQKTYQASIYVEGFEPNGGRAVNTQTSFLFSPATSLLGYKTSGEITNLNFIPANRKGSLEFIQVNSDLEQEKNFEYSFVLTQRKYVSNLVKNLQGEYYYDDTLVQEEISRQILKSRNGVISWDIPTATPGEYIVSVYAKDSTFALAEVPFNVTGQELKVNQQTIPSTMKVQLEKDTYNAGEQVEVMLSLPYDGFGLITLESDKVLSHTWFEAQAGQSMHKIAIPKDYEGRAYFVVSYMKDIDSKDIYLNPYSHSVEPILVNIDKRKIDVDLAATSLLKTADNLEVTIKTPTKTKAIVFAVDEGILALTDYQSPSPINYFLKDRALEVSTSQFLDLVMPELANAFAESEIQADSVMLRSAYGGGLAMAKENLLNPFKRKAEPPFVFWSEIIDVDARGTELSIPIPTYYNGNLRIMAVAVDDAGFGSAEANTIIRRDIIISPQMPVMASPNDKVEAGVMLVNNANFESDFALSLNVSSSIKVVNEIPKSLRLKANDEVFVPIEFEVLNELGEANIEFVVKSQGLEVKRNSSLSIRPSTPYSTNILLGAKNQAGKLVIEPETPVYPYNAKAELTASYTPNSFIQGYLSYLEDSLNGTSTEALISKAFPYVLLSDSPDVLFGHAEDAKKAEAASRKMIDEALYAIRSNARYNGLNMWYNSNKADPLLAVYAGDFLLAFRNAGYSVPRDIEVSIFDAIRNIAAQRPNTLSDARTSAYAIWVLTREGYVTTQYIENIINTLSNSSSDMRYWEQDLTLVLLASSLKIMRFDIDFEYDSYDFSYKNFKNSSFMNVFAAQSLFTRALAQSFPEKLTSERVEQMVEQSMSSFKNGQSTFAVAQAIAALSLLGSENSDVLQNSILSCANAESTVLNLSNAVGISAPLCTEFNIDVDNTAPIYYQLTTSGYPLEAPKVIAANGLDISKILLNERNEPITSVEVGEIIKVQITANSHNIPLENIVIQDLFAGAFEAVLDDDARTLEYDPNTQKEIREDRALFYVTLTPEEKVLTYEVRAVNKGTFTVPAAYANSLYDNRISANDVAQTITVK